MFLVYSSIAVIVLIYLATCIGRRCQPQRKDVVASQLVSFLGIYRPDLVYRWEDVCRGWWQHRTDLSMSAREKREKYDIKQAVIGCIRHLNNILFFFREIFKSITTLSFFSEFKRRWSLLLLSTLLIPI